MGTMMRFEGRGRCGRRTQHDLNATEHRHTRLTSSHTTTLHTISRRRVPARRHTRIQALTRRGGAVRRWPPRAGPRIASKMASLLAATIMGSDASRAAEARLGMSRTDAAPVHRRVHRPVD